MGNLREIQKKVTDFLKSIPSVQTERQRQAFVASAGLDSALEQQIEYSGSVDEFFQLLVPILTKYSKLDGSGKDAVEAILDAAYQKVGVDRQDECVELLKDWRKFKNVEHQNQLAQQSSAFRQDYLNTLRVKVGQLKLSQIAPDFNDSFPLEGIYVPLPTEYSLAINVRDYQIINWWVINKTANLDKSTVQEAAYFSKDNSNGYDVRSIEIFLNQAQEFILGVGGNISPEERERPLVLAPMWSDGVKENYKTLDIVDVAAISDRVVVVGDPGSGKSTFAKFITLCLLGEQLDPPIEGLGLGNLGTWPHGSITPLYIELRHFFGWGQLKDLDEKITVDHFWEYVRQEYLAPNYGFEKELWRDLINGNAVLIFDGLDEVPIPLDQKDGTEKRQRQVIELISSLSVRFRQSRMIVTSRPYAYEELNKSFNTYGFVSVNLSPLNSKRIYQLAFNLYKASGLISSEAENLATSLLHELKAVSNFLKDRPLFLTLMAALYLRRRDIGLPTRKGVLLQESIYLLLDRWTKERLINDEERKSKLQEADADSLYRKLEEIAYNYQSTLLSDIYEVRDIDIGEIVRELVEYYNVREILDYLIHQSGIFVNTAPRKFRFRHRTFQEFLAASYLARSGDFKQVSELVQKNTSVWRESCLYIGDMVNERVWELIEALLEGEGFRKGGEEEIQPYSVWLAGNIVVEQKLYLDTRHLHKRVILNELAGKTQEILEDYPAHLTAKDRVQIGVALGFLGDARKGVGIKNGLPDIAWCKIDSGECQIGTNIELAQKIMKQAWAVGWDFEPGNSRETPSFKLFIDEFFISRYPITQEQFRAFIKADDGYYNEDWWTKAGWEFHNSHELKPFVSHTDPPNFPQYNVSWFEAMAFCRWLSDRLNKKIRLPSEIQWEKAARGNGDRIFPWGDEVDTNLCNIAETEIRSVSPVGCFPNPDNPWGKDGPLDMCGNVWDWCTTICEKEGGTLFSYPYEPRDGREDENLGNDYLRIVRGGSFTNIPLLARITFRGRDRPSFRRPRQGFRVVKIGG